MITYEGLKAIARIGYNDLATLCKPHGCSRIASYDEARRVRAPGGASARPEEAALLKWRAREQKLAAQLATLAADDVERPDVARRFEAARRRIGRLERALGPKAAPIVAPADP